MAINAQTSLVSCIMQNKGLFEVPFEEVPQNVESLDRTGIWVKFKTNAHVVFDNHLISLPHEIGTLSNLTKLNGESSQYSHTESHSNITVHSVLQPFEIIAS